MSSGPRNAATKEERVGAALAGRFYVRELKNNEAAVEAQERWRSPSIPASVAPFRRWSRSTPPSDYAALIKLYEQAPRPRQRTDSELATVLEIGRLYWHKLSNFEQADEYYKRVRKVDLAHPEMLDFYRAFHGGRGGSRAPTTAPSCWRS